MHVSWGQTLLLVAALLAERSQSTKHEDFKKCADAAFCRRGRALASRALEAGSRSWRSPYSLDKSGISFSSAKSSFTAPIKSSIYPDVKFSLEVRVHEDGAVRVRMDETYEEGRKWKRYDEAAAWALIRVPSLAAAGVVDWKVGKKDIKGVFNGVEVRLQYEPLKITLLRDGREEIVLNGDSLLHMEHFREKPAQAKVAPRSEEPTDGAEGGDQVPLQPPEPVKLSAWFEGDEEDGLWEETFKSWTDSKPKGAPLRL